MTKVRTSDALERIQSEILEMIAIGVSLTVIAETLCRLIESIVPDAYCSIITADDEGILHPLAAPSLPRSFVVSVEGVRSGPNAGSCGTAVFRGKPVAVFDIGSDPLWSGFAESATSIGLHACWSSPIKAKDGRCIGSFAFYYSEPRHPGEREQVIVARCVHLSAIAIEHDRIRQRNLRLAYFDKLTSLPNRGHFDQAIAAQLAKNGAPWGLLLIDIDHLKEVNDVMGHSAGDAVIQHVARSIERSSAGDFAARLSGDEFAVILEDCGNSVDLLERANQLASDVHSQFKLGEHTLLPQVTIGGVIYSQAEDATTLLQNADLALYHAKEQNRGGVSEFVPGLRTSMIARVDAVNMLGEAMADGRLVVHYQPIVNLHTQEITGLEALARVELLDGEIVPAQRFAAALSDSVLAYRLTSCVLAQVAGDIRSWMALDFALPRVAVNVSTIDFTASELAPRISEIFRAEGVPLTQVLLEITEHVHMSGVDHSIAKAVEVLRAEGITVALDDFGTGYASLTHLMSFPVDAIKIDRSFVDGIERGGAPYIIARSLIEVGRSLNMKIIAEGIETDEQKKCLIALGCSYGQGFGLYRPADFSVTTDRLLASLAPRTRPLGLPSLCAAIVSRCCTAIQAYAAPWRGHPAGPRRRPSTRQ